MFPTSHRSQTVWEQRNKKNRWKALPLAMCEALEEGYANYQNKKGAVKEKILDKEVRLSYACGLT